MAPSKMFFIFLKFKLSIDFQDETIRRRGFVASFICASQALEGISKKFSAVAIFALSPKFPVTAYRQYERLLEYLLSPSGISMASIELTGKQFAQEAFIYPLDKEARPPPSLASHLGEGRFAGIHNLYHSSNCTFLF